MAKETRTRWNVWQSRDLTYLDFIKSGDKREKHIPKDARIIKFLYATSYSAALIKFHRFMDWPWSD
jgi:hypothetical protein